MCTLDVIMISLADILLAVGGLGHSTCNIAWLTKEYRRAPVSTDSVSAVSGICGVPRLENN
jgi:hypothetical protein